MHRLFSFIAMIALLLFALPVAAQQEQQQQQPTPAGESEALYLEEEEARTQRDTSPTLTEAQGIEGEGQRWQGGQAGGQQDVAGETDVTTRAAAERDREIQPGGEMPTTASPLPWVLAGGAALIGLGLGLRLLGARS